MLRETMKGLQSELDKAKQAFWTTILLRISQKVVEQYMVLSPDMIKIILTLCMRFEISYQIGWKVDCVTLESQLFIAIAKLHCNLSHIALSVRFG